jgi:hypothetical protein
MISSQLPDDAPVRKKTGRLGHRQIIPFQNYGFSSFDKPDG